MPTRCLPAIHHSFSAQNVFAVITSLIRVMMAHCSPTMMDQILLPPSSLCPAPSRSALPSAGAEKDAQEPAPSPRDHQMSPWSKVAGLGGVAGQYCPHTRMPPSPPWSWALSYTHPIQELTSTENLTTLKCKMSEWAALTPSSRALTRVSGKISTPIHLHPLRLQAQVHVVAREIEISSPARSTANTIRQRTVPVSGHLGEKKKKKK